MNWLEIDPFYLDGFSNVPPWTLSRGRRVPWRDWMAQISPLEWSYGPVARVEINGEAFALSFRWASRGHRERALGESRVDDAMGE